MDERTAVTSVEREVGVRPGATEGRFAPGAKIGRYVVLLPVGEGGMGTVYAGYDPDLDRRIALKVLRQDLFADASLDLLLAEAQSLARLRHPNVLAVHDIGTTGDGRVFIALDLVEGTDVLAWASEKHRSWREIVRVFRDAGKGLEAAHAANLIHRDFKPANVLVNREGHVFVADFGIAQPVDETPTTSTAGGTDDRDPENGACRAAGTRPYMAPEVIEGHRASFLSDQYSFGASLHEVVMGHRLGEPPSPSSSRRVPRFVRRAIARMTAATPEDRYPTLDDALQSLAADPGRRLRTAAVAVGAAGVATLAALALLPEAAAPEPCSGPDPLAGIWDDGRRSDVVATLTAARMPDGDLADVTTRLDRYAAQWRESHRDACLAGARREQSDTLVSARMACLDGRRDGLRALSNALSSVTVDGTERVPQAVSRLADVELCDDLTLLSQRVALPDSAEQRAAIEELRAEIAEHRAGYDLGQTSASAAREPAERLVARAREIGYQPLLAEALMFRARTVPIAAAVASDLETMGVAQAGRDFETQVRVAPSLIIDLCNAGRYGEASLVASIGRGAYAAAQRPRALDRDALALELMLAMCESRAADVVRFGTQLYEKQIASTDPVTRWKAAACARNVAASYVYVEDFENAALWADRANDVLREFAKVDPALLQTRLGVAWAALALGDRDRVASALSSLDEVVEALGPDASDLRCAATMTHGLAALLDDDRARASALLDEAARCTKDAGAAGSTHSLLGLQARAELAIAAGNPGDALALAREGIDLVKRDPNDKKIVLFRAVAARALARKGDLDDAERELSLAAPHLPEDGPHEQRWALVQLARAESALARGDTATAIELASAAREARARRGHAFHVHEIDTVIDRATGTR